MKEIVHVFIFVGALQAFFFCLLILLKKKKEFHDYWFLTFLFVMGTGQLLHYLRWEGHLQAYMPHLLRVRFLFPAFVGPLFFLFTLSINKHRLSRRNIWFYLSPGIVNIALLMPYLLLAAEIKLTTLFKEYSPVAYYLHYGISRISLLIFSWLAYRYLSKKSPSKWLKNIAVAMIINSIILIVINITDFFFFDITSYYYINIFNTLLVFIIGYFTMSRGKLFHNDDLDIKGVKYEKSGLSKKSAENLLARMDSLMEDHKLYRQQGLTQNQIAAALETSTNHVSQALNQMKKQKFSEYINSCRVEDFKEKIEQPAFKLYTLLAVAETCGFGSKASFNTVFRKFTGQTPSDYLKSIGSVLQE